MFTLYIERKYNYTFLENTSKRIFFYILKFIGQPKLQNEWTWTKRNNHEYFKLWIVLNYDIKED